MPSVNPHPPGDALPPDAPAEPLTVWRRRWTLITMCAALGAVTATIAGINVTLRAIASDLGADQGQLLWIVDAYTLTLAALLLPAGALGDRIGRRRVLLVGLVTFLVATAGGLLAPSPGWLIAARAVAGLGGALLLPSTLSIIVAVHPSEMRGKAVGIWSGFAAGSSGFGLFVAAALVDTSWRWAFAPALVIAAACVVGTVMFVPDSREQPEGAPDWLGGLTSALIVGGCVLALMEGPSRGWLDPLVLSGVAIALLAGLAFLFAEARAEAPLLEPQLFRDRRLAGGALGLTVTFVTAFGFILVYFQYAEGVLGMSALVAALTLIPANLLNVAISPQTPRLTGRFGLRKVLVTGLGVCAAGVAISALTATSQETWAALVGLNLVLGGLAVLMSPATTAISEALPLHRQGVASALNDTVREVGAAIGIALMGSFLNAGYRAELAGNLPEAMPAPVQGALRSGPGAFDAIAPSLGAARESTQALVNDALSHGYARSMVACLIALVLGIALVARVSPPRVKKAKAARVDSWAVAQTQSRLEDAWATAQVRLEVSDEHSRSPGL